MPKTNTSFEQDRKQLLIQIKAKSSKATVEKVIEFQNEDVPTFLRDLSRFDQESRRSQLTVK